jgi:hypothetical protein
MAGSGAVGQGANSEANVEPDGELWVAGAAADACDEAVGTNRDVGRGAGASAARL